MIDIPKVPLPISFKEPSTHSAKLIKMMHKYGYDQIRSAQRNSSSRLYKNTFLIWICQVVVVLFVVFN